MFGDFNISLFDWKWFARNNSNSSQQTNFNGSDDQVHQQVNPNAQFYLPAFVSIVIAVVSIIYCLWGRCKRPNQPVSQETISYIYNELIARQKAEAKSKQEQKEKQYQHNNRPKALRSDDEYSTLKIDEDADEQDALTKELLDVKGKLINRQLENELQQKYLAFKYEQDDSRKQSVIQKQREGEINGMIKHEPDDPNQVNVGNNMFDFKSTNFNQTNPIYSNTAQFQTTPNTTNSMHSNPTIPPIMITYNPPAPINPPKQFSKGNNPKKWLDTYETYINVSNLSGSRNQKDILLSFCDESIRSVLKAQQYQGDDNNQYQLLKAYLLTIFKVREDTNEEKIRKFGTRHQLPNESVNLFAAQLVKIADKAFEGLTDQAKERLVKERFCSGLNSQALQLEAFKIEQQLSFTELVHQVNRYAERLLSMNLYSIQPDNTYNQQIQQPNYQMPSNQSNYNYSNSQNNNNLNNNNNHNNSSHSNSNNRPNNYSHYNRSYSNYNNNKNFQNRTFTDATQQQPNNSTNQNHSNPTSSNQNAQNSNQNAQNTINLVQHSLNQVPNGRPNQCGVPN